MLAVYYQVPLMFASNICMRLILLFKLMCAIWFRYHRSYSVFLFFYVLLKNFFLSLAKGKKAVILFTYADTVNTLLLFTRINLFYIRLLSKKTNIDSKTILAQKPAFTTQMRYFSNKNGRCYTLVLFRWHPHASVSQRQFWNADFQNEIYTDNILVKVKGLPSVITTRTLSYSRVHGGMICKLSYITSVNRDLSWQHRGKAIIGGFWQLFGKIEEGESRAR